MSFPRFVIKGFSYPRFVKSYAYPIKCWAYSRFYTRCVLSKVCILRFVLSRIVLSKVCPIQGLSHQRISYSRFVLSKVFSYSRLVLSKVCPIQGFSYPRFVRNFDVTCPINSLYFHVKKVTLYVNNIKKSYCRLPRRETICQRSSDPFYIVGQYFLDT